MACVAAISVGSSGTTFANPGIGQYDETDRLNEWSAGIPASPGLQQWAKESGFVGATVPKPDKQEGGAITVAEFGTGCIAILQAGHSMTGGAPFVEVRNRFRDSSKVRIGDHYNGIVRLRYSTDPEYVRTTLARYGYGEACA